MWYLKSMERSYDSVLRIARGHVIPQIPELATELRDDSQAILHAVKMDIEDQGVDPFEIHWTNLNRTERQSISGFLIREQTNFLVEGTGTEARFRLDEIKEYRQEPQSTNYYDELGLLLAAGSRYVKHTYSHGDAPENRWWRQASRRYVGLHVRASLYSLVKHRTLDTALEAWVLGLGRALRSKGLPSALSSILEQAGEDGVPAESAHDIAVVPTGFASLHILELMAFNSRKQDESHTGDESFQHHEGLQRWRYEYKNPGRDDSLMPRLMVNTARLKCSAHAIVPGQDGGIGSAQTALNRLVHASINLGVEHYGMLKSGSDQTC